MNQVIPLNTRLHLAPQSEVHKASIRETIDIAIYTQLLILGLLLYIFSPARSYVTTGVIALSIGIRFWRVKRSAAIFLVSAVFSYFLALGLLAQWMAIPSVANCGWLSFITLSANLIGNRLGRGMSSTNKPDIIIDDDSPSAA